jgi:hypothetical protein
VNTMSTHFHYTQVIVIMVLRVDVLL